jgi:uncharacterized membrane protein YqhA
VSRFLAACRYVLIVPVVGCIALTTGVVIMGVGRLVRGAMVLASSDFSAKEAKYLSLAVIEIIDLFLIGTVAYIAAIGLYRLFISKKGIELPMRLKIDTLKDLEDKIIGVIVAALAVAFLGHAAGGDEPNALMRYGGGIALVIVALAFFMRSGEKKPTEAAEK